VSLLLCTWWFSLQVTMMLPSLCLASGILQQFLRADQQPWPWVCKPKSERWWVCYYPALNSPWSLERIYILSHFPFFFFSFFIFLLLFICAYKAWFISPPCPHPLPYHPLRPLPLPQ
jgi:hypothetical protein